MPVLAGAVLAVTPLTALLLLVLGVVFFALVVGVCVAVLAVLQAILPRTDSGADAVDRARAEEEGIGEEEEAAFRP